jgi:hypothetical protein
MRTALGKRRSQGCKKENKPLKIKVGSDVYRCGCNIFAIISDSFPTAFSPTFARA